MNVRYTAMPARTMLTRPDKPYHEWSEGDAAAWTLFYKDSNRYVVRFPELGEFELSVDGQTVTGWPMPDVPTHTIEHLFLNVVQPLALSRQGVLVLHGSAVEIDGHAAAFLGASGMGKSTLATSFAVSGNPFLTDDGLVIEWRSGRCFALPSHPSVRLWDDSEEALIPHDVERAPELAFTSKARLLAGPEIAFCGEPRPLRRIYFLNDEEVTTPRFTKVKPSEALIRLAENSFLLDAQAQDLIAKRFSDLAQLADLPIFYALDFPREFETLPEVRHAIIQHVSIGDQS